MDLLHPEGVNVNDGIPSELCSLKYPSVDDAVRMIKVLGKGTALATFDIKNAYRMVPVHPADRRLLGMSWRGQVYMEIVLPFGLRSAPKTFTAVADALQFMLQKKGVAHVLHYLDDFCCSVGHIQIALEWCSKLGVPIAEQKTEGPAKVITFLGIKVDTLECQLRLPSEKLQPLQEDIKLWTRGHKVMDKAKVSH